MASYTWRKDERLITRKIADETLLVPLINSMESEDAIYALNEVGAYIWALVDGERSLTQISLSLSKEFNISLEEANRDVYEFCTTLQDEGLLHLCAS